MTRIICIISVVFNIALAGTIIYLKGGTGYVKLKLGITHVIIPDHETNYFAKESIYEAMPPAEGTIVFIGTSLTENCDWNEFFPDLKVLNRGIGGDWTKGVLERLDKIVSGHPYKVFLEIGIADLNDRPHDIARIMDNYKGIILRIHERSPATRVYVQSVLPVQDVICRFMKKKSEEIISLNQRLRLLAAECGASFIDLFPAFTTPDNQLVAAYTFDGGHVNGKGYIVWKSIIEKYVRE